MIYLSGSLTPELQAIGHPRIGAMIQPRSRYSAARIDMWPMFAADNGGYGGKFDPARWLPWLDRVALRADRCLFAVVPDRFDPADLAGNFAATQAMWGRWSRDVTDRGLVAAWVAQNGATPDDIPPDAGAVFIGGDTRWKLSEQAWAIVAAGKARGLHAHIGRVNGLPRFHAAYISGADSADGNLLRYGYQANIGRVLGWLDATTQPTLGLLHPL